MKVKYNGIVYEVYWKYRRYDSYHDHDSRGRIIAIPQSEYTECHIESLSNGVSIIELAEKSPQDQFNKEIGRKISLTRALKQLFPEDKKARRYFWLRYHSRFPILTEETISLENKLARQAKQLK